MNKIIVYRRKVQYYLLHYDFSNVISGSAQPQITRQGLEKVIVQICEKTKQKEIVSVLSNINDILNLEKDVTSWPLEAGCTGKRRITSFLL